MGIIILAVLSNQAFPPVENIFLTYLLTSLYFLLPHFYFMKCQGSSVYGGRDKIIMCYKDAHPVAKWRICLVVSYSYCMYRVSVFLQKPVPESWAEAVVKNKVVLLAFQWRSYAALESLTKSGIKEETSKNVMEYNWGTQWEHELTGSHLKGGGAKETDVTQGQGDSDRMRLWSENGWYRKLKCWHQGIRNVPLPAFMMCTRRWWKDGQMF